MKIMYDIDRVFQVLSNGTLILHVTVSGDLWLFFNGGDIAVFSRCQFEDKDRLHVFTAAKFNRSLYFIHTLKHTKFFQMVHYISL